MVFNEEFLNSLPVLSEEELKNNFWDTDELVHTALAEFTTECDKIDREYGDNEIPRLSCDDISLDSISERFVKVDFEKYRNTFSVEQLEEFVSGRGNEFSAGDVRSLMYGYTFTDEYARHPESSVFDNAWWTDRLGQESGLSDQEILIAEAILGTGDGKSAESAFCVIDIYQEYNLISLLMPHDTPLVKKQTLLEGWIDCLEFEPNAYGVEKMYFDVHRRFEVGYNNDDKD